MTMTSQAPKPYKEERPWGNFIEFSKNRPSTVKIITVKEGESLSLQSHEGRDEFWRIIAGKGAVTVGTKRVECRKGDEFFVPRKTKHMIEGGTAGDLEVLEIAFGDFDEADIKRFSDRYGRS